MCNYCSAKENKYGNVHHAEDCVFATAAGFQSNWNWAYSQFDQHVKDSLNESDIVEEFRQKLERVNNTDSKRKKMKPNISNDWLKELRKRLNSISTNENSIERLELKGPASGKGQGARGSSI